MNVVSPRQGYRIPEDCARKFRAEKLIGSGGYGAVLLATQLELERPVVVKILLGNLSDPDLKRRFDDEARIAASLSDPHIVRVLDHGADTVPWIAFEFVPGGSLRARLAAGRLAAHEVVQVGAQVCHALEAAHAARILHRDVKPDNILQVTPELWKLTDFGVARWDESSRVPTQNGVVLGTPAYLAPEVIRGEATDGRQDLYALGATLYELATGQPPFQNDNPYRVVEMQLSATPVPPTDLVPDLPRELEAIILQSLAKDRNDRYPDATAMAAALQRLATPARRAAPRSRPGGPGPATAALSAPAPSGLAAGPPPARGWSVATAALSLAAAFALGAWLVRPAALPPPAPAARASVADPAAALVRELSSLDASALDGPRLAAILDRLAALPAIERRLELPAPLAARLAQRIVDESGQLEDDLEAALEAERERATLLTIPGHDIHRRCENRREYIQRMLKADDQVMKRLQWRYAERRAVLGARLRALFTLDLTLFDAEIPASLLGWELLMAGLFFPGDDLASIIRSAEDGRPPCWVAAWAHAHLAARAGDERLASRYAGRAMRLARETARPGDPQETAIRVADMIRALTDFAPGRGQPFHDALAEARLLAEGLPPGSLPQAVLDLLKSPRPRR